ncbi:MAG TPA: hypothetical protein PL033_05250 [Candidatus Brocadiia bacterium]|nr:hypothetical protein [Candidatus Brocadiia bacterium]
MAADPRTIVKVVGLYAALIVIAGVSYLLYMKPARVDKALAEIEVAHGTQLYGGAKTYEEARLQKRAASDRLIRMNAAYARQKLINMLTDANVLTRKYAARTLGYLGAREDEERLIRAVEGSNKERDTRDALGGSIWDAVSDPQKEARGEAVIALARMNGDAGFEFVKKTMESDKALASYCALAMWVSPREGTDAKALAAITIGSRDKLKDSAYDYIRGEKALEFVPLLIEVLRIHAAPDCNIANEVLQDITGQEIALAFPEVPLPKSHEDYREPAPTPESRAEAVKQWLGWWESNKDRAVPLRREPRRSYDIKPDAGKQ